MAKFGIYSDVHISHNSSILPTYQDDNDYTTRLQMCKDSIKWAYKIFEEQSVDAVINCGDTFNSHIVSADELCSYINVIKDCYKPYDRWTPELDFTLIGNHDKFNNVFSSMNILELSNYSDLVNPYDYFDTFDIDCYVISYFEADEFVENCEKMLKEHPKKHNLSVLFMHGDINGSFLGANKVIENKIEKKYLMSNFDIIINGHIHLHEILSRKDNKLICNIGSLTTHSFADSNNHIAACYILDTNTYSIEQFINPHQIAFRTYTINNDEDIHNVIDILKNKEYSFKHIVKIKCPFEMKDQIEKSLNSISNVIKYKFVFTYNNKIDNDENPSEASESDNSKNTYNNIYDEFLSFLNDRNDLKYDINTYKNIINNIQTSTNQKETVQ